MVTSADGKPSSGYRPTYVVENSFTTPTDFLGWSVEKLRTHYLEHWELPYTEVREWPYRTERTFVVLDERTLEDDTALLVALNDRDKGPITLARSEFDCIGQVIYWVDDGASLDAEEFNGKKRGMENGMLVYRVRWYKKENAHRNGWPFENNEIDYDDTYDDKDFVWGYPRDENGFDTQHPNYVPEDPEFGPDPYEGVLFPVFLTAQIPLEVCMMTARHVGKLLIGCRL